MSHPGFDPQPAGRFDEEADAVIVGSGAAGATCAKLLAEAGWSVLLLEEGAWVPPEQRGRSLAEGMRQVFRDYGTLVTRGSALIPILQGRVLGGTTTINAGIVWRLPEQVHAAWCAADPTLAAALPFAALERHWDRIERDLRVAPVAPRVVGRNNHLMRAGAEAAGLEGRWIHRNAPDCRGNTLCMIGCPEGNKLSMEVTYIPAAVARGARVFPECRVERLGPPERDGAGPARVRTVFATLRDPHTGEVRGRLRARARRAVIVAASAIQSPALIRRSGLGTNRMGDGLMAHPGCALAARFDEPVRMWEGIHQGYESLALRDEGIKLESIGLPPEMAAVRVAGVGRAWQANIEQLDHMTLWAVAACCEARGRVRPGWNHGVRVRFSLTARDVYRVQRGLRVLAEMAFAAGARAVMPGLHRVPEELTDPAQLRLIDETPLAARDLQLLATHLMSSAPMGSDPRRHAVDPGFQVYGAPGLYVADSSVFPTNIGVNPQHTIMALAGLLCDRLCDAA